jgi:hypothetical protein
MNSRPKSPLLVFALLAAVAVTGIAQNPPPADEDNNKDGNSSTQPPAPPSAKDVMEFIKQRPRNEPIQPTEETNPSRTVESQQQRLRARLMEGSMIIDRAGRLTKDGDWWAFSFESDSPEHPEPPIRLLPNRLLERMVRESDRGSDRIVYIISAEITEFEGMNYLLLDKLLRQRTMGNLSK